MQYDDQHHEHSAIQLHEAIRKHRDAILRSPCGHYWRDCVACEKTDLDLWDMLDDEFEGA